MNKVIEMKAIVQEGEAAESREYHTHDGDLEVRMDMTRELREMGLESDAIERILSIRIRSEGEEE